MNFENEEFFTNTENVDSNQNFENEITKETLVSYLDEPLAAIVVPVYNDEEYIEACLDSILAQSVPCWEAWLIDDCSEDGSLDIIKRYCELDHRFHLLQNNTNSSAWVSRAKGILAASDSVKYILFADADDTVQLNMVERALELMKEDPVDILHFGSNVENCSGIPRERIRNYTNYLQPPTAKLQGREIFDSFVSRSFEGHLWNKMFNASLLKEVIRSKGRDRILPKAQDKALYWAVCWHKDDITYRGVSDRLYNYNYGLGVEGDSSALSLEQYKQYLCQAYTEDFIAEVMNEHLEEKEQYTDVMEQSRYNLVRHSIKNYMRIPDLLKPEALKMACEYWSGDMDAARLVCALAEYTWNGRISASKIFEKTDIFKTSKKSSDFKVIGTYYHRMDNGGIQRVIANIMGYWHEMGYEIVLFTDSDPTENDYPLADYVKRVKVDRPQSRCKASNYFERGMSLARLIKENNVDCMVYHSYFSDVLLYDICICKCMDVPFIIHEHNVFTKFLHTNDVKFSTVPIFAKLADSIICLSETDKKWWDCFHSNVHVVLNPLTLSIENCAPAPRDNKNILFLCRFEESSKRPNDAISIAKKVIERHPDAKMYMVGTSENKDYLESLNNRIKRLKLEDKIIMCGFHQDVEQYYLDSSVFLSCSAHEGFMLTLCEAMSFNIPIVMYELPYLPTVENNPGVISVPQRDEDAAADAICNLFENPAILAKTGDMGREFLDKMYETDIGEQWKKVFVSLDRSEDIVCNKDMQDIASLIITSFLDGKSYTNKIIKDLKDSNSKLEEEKKKLTSRNKALESKQKVMDDLKLNRVDYIENELNKLKSIVQQKEDYKIELIMTRASFTYKIGRLITWLPRKIKGLFKK